MRINDLARELEVKSREILEALPELGIDGKRSHSSSLEEDQIEKVKAYFKGGTSASEPRRDNSRSRVDEEPEGVGVDVALEQKASSSEPR